MGCYVVAEFLLTSVSRGPSAIAEPLVQSRDVTSRENWYWVSPFLSCGVWPLMFLSNMWRRCI